MIIDRRIEPFVISDESSIQEAAAKIARHKGRIIFCVDQNGRLAGSISNGDLVRWIASDISHDENASAISIANRSVQSARPDQATEQITRLLSELLYVPP